MNLSELQTQISDRYRSKSRNFITDPEILLELNRSIARLHGKVDIETTVRQATFVVNGSGFYTFSGMGINDVKRPISLFDGINILTYKRVTKSFLDQDIINSNNEYSMRTTGIYVSTTTPQTTLTFTYYSKNDSFNAAGDLQQGLSASTDYPALQDRFHDYFVEDTAAVLYRKEKKFDDYKVAKTEAAEIYADIIDENPTRNEKVVELVTGYPQFYT